MTSEIDALRDELERIDEDLNAIQAKASALRNMRNGLRKKFAHLTALERKKLFPCECGKSFPTKHALTYHKRGKCGGRRACPDCGREFTELGLEKHLAHKGLAATRQKKDIWVPSHTDRCPHILDATGRPCPSRRPCPLHE